jgi:hypothetical protein
MQNQSLVELSPPPPPRPSEIGLNNNTGKAREQKIHTHILYFLSISRMDNWRGWRIGKDQERFSDDRTETTCLGPRGARLRFGFLFANAWEVGFSERAKRVKANVERVVSVVVSEYGGYW